MNTWRVTFQGGRDASAAGQDASLAEAGLRAFIEEFLGATAWTVRVVVTDRRGGDRSEADARRAARFEPVARRRRLTGAAGGDLVLRAAVRLGADRLCLVRTVWSGGATPPVEAGGQGVAIAIANLANQATDVRLAERSDGLLRRALDLLDLGLIVVADAGRVVYANRAARALAALDGRTERLGGARLRMTPDFHHAVSKRGGRDLIVVPSEKSGCGRAAFVCRLPDEPGRRSAYHLVVVPTWRGPTDEGAVARAFGLPPAEARVALEIARGESVRGAAERLALREESVRTYLKRVFLRLGVARQNELAALVAQSIAPVIAAEPPAERAGGAGEIVARSACGGARLSEPWRIAEGS